jgi:hypothetical protein
MSHPAYYTDLLRRRFSADPALTPAERRELDLHLLICPECNYDYTRLLLPHAPDAAESLLEELEGALTADLVTPYLRDLVQAVRGDRPMTGFLWLLWQFVCRDHEALGRFRLMEADEIVRTAKVRRA